MLSAVACALMLGAPLKVELKNDGGKYSLRVDGKPYFVKGAGCSDNTDEQYARLKAAGGNSVRTWGTDNRTEELLDRAQKNGLTVQLGYWLGHVEHGFKWNNQDSLKDQRGGVRNMVRLYKDHPAVLTWALGNEMEAGNNTPELWQEVEVLAQIVKKEDPYHRPILTVVAEMDQQKSDYIQKYCPSVDIVGINTYGGLPSLKERLTKFGFKKPYIVTEFGPAGPWESAKTAWGAALEVTSTQKAENYAKNYENQILGNPTCLGSYAFIWGNKQEETSTWFGMWLPTGENTGAVDVMTKYWSGNWPKNRCPAITSFSLSANSVSPGGKLTATVTATDPEGDALKFEWQVVGESTDKRTGGAAEQVPPTVNSTTGSSTDEFTAPAKPGPYRIFLIVRDGKGNAASANLPFLVK